MVDEASSTEQEVFPVSDREFSAYETPAVIDAPVLTHAELYESTPVVEKPELVDAPLPIESVDESVAVTTDSSALDESSNEAPMESEPPNEQGVTQ